MKQFDFHKLNADGQTKAKDIARRFEILTGELGLTVPAPGAEREAALALTKLEEACFYAKKAMALDPSNQEKSIATLG